MALRFSCIVFVSRMFLSAAVATFISCTHTEVIWLSRGLGASLSKILALPVVLIKGAALLFVTNDVQIRATRFNVSF